MNKIIFLVFFLFPINSFAASVTVCDSGCNYSTIASALSAVGNGNHTITVRLPYTANERITINKSGTGVGSELTVRANPGEKITTKGFRISSANYVILDGFDITGAWGANNAGIDVYHSNFCIIRNNKIHDPDTALSFLYLRRDNPRSTNCTIKNNEMYHDGITRDDVVVECYGSNHLFESNSIHDVTADAFYYFGNGHVFRSNTIYNANQLSSGLHVDMFQTFGDNGDEAYDIIIERNLMYNCTGQLFFMTQDGVANIRDITFRNNIWYNISLAGQTFVPRTFFYNNIIYKGNWENADHPVMYRSSGFGSATDGKILNNIFIGCGNNSSQGWYSIESGASGVERDYNYVAKDSPGFGAFSGFTGTEAHGISGGDPKFVNLPGRNLHLQSGSPAIDKGTDLSSTGFTDDMDGLSRPAGSSWDIGAFEFGASSSSPPSGGGESGESNEGSGGGCFIATAAFGSPLAQEIFVLKEFRDKYLTRNLPGRAFLSLYSTLSPPLARVIAKNHILKFLVRVNIYPLVGLSYLLLKYPHYLNIISLALLLAACVLFIARRISRQTFSRNS